ncbi:MAG: hypothetical protein AAFU73_05290 [Planctomycetota bacterium]
MSDPTKERSSARDRLRGIVRLVEGDDSNVVVHLADNDIAVLDMKRTIDVLKEHLAVKSSHDDFRHRLELLLAKLAAWLREKCPSLLGAYIEVRPAAAQFVVNVDSAYSEEFEDLLTELERDVMQDADVAAVDFFETMAFYHGDEEAISDFIGKDAPMVLKFNPVQA